MNTREAFINLYEEVSGYLSSGLLGREDIVHMLEFKYELIDRISEFDEDEDELDCECECYNPADYSEVDLSICDKDELDLITAIGKVLSINNLLNEPMKFKISNGGLVLCH